MSYADLPAKVAALIAERNALRRDVEELKADVAELLSEPELFSPPPKIAYEIVGKVVPVPPFQRTRNRC